MCAWKTRYSAAAVGSGSLNGMNHDLNVEAGSIAVAPRLWPRTRMAVEKPLSWNRASGQQLYASLLGIPVCCC